MLGLKLIHVSKKGPSCKAAWNVWNTHSIGSHYKNMIWYNEISYAARQLQCLDSNYKLTEDSTHLTIINEFRGIYCRYFQAGRLRKNCCHFTDGIFKCIFVNENVWIWLKISLKIVPKVRINNIPTLVQIMAWHWPVTKPLSESMMITLWMNLCVAGLQWVKKKISFWCNFVFFCYSS